MGQKVNPNGFRLGIHKGWHSNWLFSAKEMAKEVPALLVEEDHRVRTFVKRELINAGVSRIELSRKVDHIQIDIYTARPGVVVGKGGSGLDTLNQKVRTLINRPGLDVKINVLEVNRVDLESQLVAESIAQQLEKRVAFRRAMKQAMQRCMRAGAHGVKIMVAGRLGGAEIARTEWSKDGRIPLQTLRADIDYGFAEANTMMGKIGCKVWVYRGELERGQMSPPNVKAQTERPQDAANRAERGERSERGDRGGNGGRGGRRGKKQG